MRLPIQHLKPLSADSLVRRAGERYHLILINDPPFECLRHVDPLDPFVYHGIQAMHIEFDLDVLVDLDLHHILFSSGAPEFHPCRGHKHRQRLLREDPSIHHLLSIPEFHNKRELLEGTVEGRVHEFVPRYLLSHTVPLDDDILLPALDLLRGHSVQAARPRESLGVFLEPFLVRPVVLREETVREREAEFGDVQVSPIPQAEMGVGCPKHSHVLCLGMHSTSRIATAPRVPILLRTLGFHRSEDVVHSRIVERGRAHIGTVPLLFGKPTQRVRDDLVRVLGRLVLYLPIFCSLIHLPFTCPDKQSISHLCHAPMCNSPSRPVILNISSSSSLSV